MMLPKKYAMREGLGFMRIHKRLIVIIIIIYKRIRQSKRFVILIRRLFAVSRCSRCRAGIFATELVMRARDLVYHVACFTCASCGTPLNKGDHFGQRDGLVYCRWEIRARITILQRPSLCYQRVWWREWQKHEARRRRTLIIVRCSPNDSPPARVNPVFSILRNRIEREI